MQTLSKLASVFERITGNADAQLVVGGRDVVVVAKAVVAGRGVVTIRSSRRIVGERLPISLLAGILGLRHRVRSIHRRARVPSVVTRSNCTRAGSGQASSCHLCICRSVCLLVAFPEWRASRARRVVVRGRSAVALLLLVVADEEDLHYGGEEEKEDVDDGNGESGCFDLARTMQIVAGVAGTGAENGIHVAMAGPRSTAVVVGYGSEAAGEQEVEDDEKEADEGVASEEEGEEDAEKKVEHSGPGHAFNRTNPYWDVDLMAGQMDEKV